MRSWSEFKCPSPKNCPEETEHNVVVVSNSYLEENTPTTKHNKPWTDTKNTTSRRRRLSRTCLLTTTRLLLLTSSAKINSWYDWMTWKWADTESSVVIVFVRIRVFMRVLFSFLHFTRDISAAAETLKNRKTSNIPNIPLTTSSFRVHYGHKFRGNY